MAVKSTIESWEKVRSIARRSLVAVIGSDPYFERRIRSWWMEKSNPPYIEMPSDYKEFNKQLSNILVPSIIVSSKSLIVPELHEDIDPLYLFKVLWDDNHLLVFLGRKNRLSEEDINWFKRRSSSKLGLIELDVRGRLDGRKIKWAREIALDLDVDYEDSALRNMLDWCEWDLGRFENESLKANLLFVRDSKAKIAINHLEKHWPLEIDKARDIDKLSGGRLENYFLTLDITYRNAPSAAERKRILNRHLKMCEQMRLLALVNKEADLEEQSEFISKMQRYPMSEWQLKRFLDRTKIQCKDVLTFLHYSSEWIKRNFLKKD